MNTFSVIGALILLGILIILVYKLNNKDTFIIKVRNGEIFDLKPSFELTQGLSVVTLYQGNKGYNFLVDTGSNNSHIVANSDMVYTLTGTETTTYGLGSEEVVGKWATVVLYHNQTKYEIPAIVGSIDSACEALKKDTGVTVHGILGSNFLTCYGKILDYKNLIMCAAQ